MKTPDILQSHPTPFASIFAFYFVTESLQDAVCGYFAFFVVFEGVINSLEIARSESL
jgi:hypothetical protein